MTLVPSTGDDSPVSDSSEVTRTDFLDKTLSYFLCKDYKNEATGYWGHTSMALLKPMCFIKNLL